MLSRQQQPFRRPTDPSPLFFEQLLVRQRPRLGIPPARLEPHLQQQGQGLQRLDDPRRAQGARLREVHQLLAALHGRLKVRRRPSTGRSPCASADPPAPSSSVVLYTCFFAAYSAVVVHTLLYHRKEISNGFKVAYKSIRAGQKGNLSFKDWHNQTMAQYDEVPEWCVASASSAPRRAQPLILPSCPLLPRWYLIFTVCAVVLGVLGLTLYPTNASVSAIFFGIALCILFVIPIGIITSITGAQITLNVFAEFIGGLIYPGNALAMNYFKSYGVVSCMNAIQFAQDLKLGHYMKIGQRYTFIVQVYGSIIACCVATSILNWQMSLPKICQLDQPQHFYCNGETTFFTATVFWGTLGPTRIFGKGGMYAMLLTGASRPSHSSMSSPDRALG
jgi:uncharacterized membrane protein YtjA (UPF0391 family)